MENGCVAFSRDDVFVTGLLACSINGGLINGLLHGRLNIRNVRRSGKIKEEGGRKGKIIASTFSDVKGVYVFGVNYFSYDGHYFSIFINMKG